MTEFVVTDTTPASLDELASAMVADLRDAGWPITEKGEREIRKRMEILRGPSCLENIPEARN